MVSTVAEYIEGFDGLTRERLDELRRLVLDILPDAVEGVSYGVAGFKVQGRPVVYLGGFAKHREHLPHHGPSCGSRSGGGPVPIWKGHGEVLQHRAPAAAPHRAARAAPRGQRPNRVNWRVDEPPSVSRHLPLRRPLTLRAYATDQLPAGSRNHARGGVAPLGSRATPPSSVQSVGLKGDAARAKVGHGGLEVVGRRSSGSCALPATWSSLG